MNEGIMVVISVTRDARLEPNSPSDQACHGTNKQRLDFERHATFIYLRVPRTDLSCLNHLPQLFRVTLYLYSCCLTLHLQTRNLIHYPYRLYILPASSIGSLLAGAVIYVFFCTFPDSTSTLEICKTSRSAYHFN